jgi:hypothetical protein
MNTAALLGPYRADRVLAWENGHPMTYGHFLSDVGALADLLPEKRSLTWLMTAIGFWSGSPQHWSEDRPHCFLLVARRAP